MESDGLCIYTGFGVGIYHESDKTLLKSIHAFEWGEQKMHIVFIDCTFYIFTLYNIHPNKFFLKHVTLNTWTANFAMTMTIPENRATARDRYRAILDVT